MSTSIEWTDATWNPVTGCSKVSPGCARCYAERLAPKVFAGQEVVCGGPKGKPIYRPRVFTDVMEHEARLEQPLHWRKPRRVFVNSMSDLFHEAVPDAFIDRVFAVMALAPQHTFQILTKRAERMRAYFAEPLRRGCIAEAWWDAQGKSPTVSFATSPLDTWPLRNVWLGVSVENQHFADARIPVLLQTPAAVRFISAEPLLEQITIPDVFVRKLDWGEGPKHWPDGAGVLDWVIVGGESGPGARPFDLAWARSIVQQCQAAGVPVFVKQLGAWPRTTEFPNDVTANGFPLTDRRAQAGDRLLLRNRKGGDPAEWPEDLRVREFP